METVIVEVKSYRVVYSEEKSNELFGGGGGGGVLSGMTSWRK